MGKNYAKGEIPDESSLAEHRPANGQNTNVPIYHNLNEEMANPVIITL